MRLVKSTDPILKEKIEEATEAEALSYFEDSLRMHAVMASKDAVGMAAPQVGLRYRMFVMSAESRTVINPKILNRSEEETIYDEGCLSFPQLWLKVKRPVWVDVEYLTFDDGNEDEATIVTKKERLYGIDCQCYCHELEHLDGITFDTKVPSFTLRTAKKKQRKLLKRVKSNYDNHRVSRIRSYTSE